MSREDYLYATGVVRYLETKTLNTTDVERMVDAPDLAAAFKVFNDTDYFDNIKDLKPDEFSQALLQDLLQVRERIIEMTPDDEIIKLIFMRYDFRNMKLLYKAHFANKKIDSYISNLGNEDPDKLKRVISGEKVEILPYCQRAIDYVKQRVEDEKKSATPALIGRWFDRKYFKEYQDQAKRFRSKFIEDFVKLQLDIANLKIFIRGKLLDLPKDYIVSEILFSQSRQAADPLSLEFYATVVDLSLDEALQKIRLYLPLSVQKVVDKYVSEKLPLEQLEKLLEDAENDYLREAKYIDNGPELLLAYYYSKRNAIRNTRIIMTGKANKMPAAEIKKLIRELY